MAIGNSGRIVVVLEPELKQELYAALHDDGLTLKEWFQRNLGSYLSNRGQLPLVFSDQPESRTNR